MSTPETLHGAGPADAAPNRWHRVFEEGLPPPAIAALRSAIDQSLGRRGPLAEGARDMKWWINLRNIQEQFGTGPIRQILASACQSPAVRWALSVVGDDPVLVLDYCILRHFDPSRNPMPAEWHFDGNILGLATPIINVWTPLVDVGEMAPGLTLVPEPRKPAALWRKMWDLSHEGGYFDAQNREDTKFSTEEVEACVAADPDAEFFTPKVRAGGAITFDQEHIHSTQKLTDAMGVRDSFEIRVMSERVAIAAGLHQRCRFVKLS